MPKYACPYVSDGVVRSAVIRAGSASEAAEKMALLPWAEGCGPTGRPQRLRERIATHRAAGLSLVAVALAASSAILALPGEILLSEIVPWTLPG